MKNLATLIFSLLLFAVVSSSQTNVQNSSIENSWKGIIPLKTDKVFVEKLLGKSERVSDSGYHYYRTDEAFVEVNYSTFPCADNQYKRGQYNVSENTVLDYTVNLNKPVKISDFRFKKEKYYREEGYHLKNLAYYRNHEEGISITVMIDEDIEYVGQIRIRPSKKKAEELRCID